MKLSIIIPAYNAAKYIERCLRSILTNNIVDEIYVVDDGSNDETVDIVRSVSALDKRVFLISQKNSGPAFARMNALKYVKNNFVSFIDADDYVLEYGYDKLFSEYEILKYDILEFGYNEISESGKEKLHVNELEIHGDRCADFFIKGRSNNYLWNKIFHKKLFENIKTLPLYYSEDAYWLAQIYLNVNHYKRVKMQVYNHMINSQSLCSQVNTSHADDQIIAWEAIRGLYAEQFNKLLPAINMKLCSIAIILYSRSRDDTEKEKYLHLFKQYKKEISFCKLISNCSFYRRLMIMLFSISPQIVTKFLNKR